VKRLQTTQTNGGMAMTPERIALIKRSIAKDATDDETADAARASLYDSRGHFTRG